MTGLQARTFAVWTALSGVVRLYAAYNISSKAFVLRFRLVGGTSADATHLMMGSVYDMTLFTYLFAFGHFASELLIFRTASFGLGVLSPVLVSGESIMLDLATRWFDPSNRVITCSRVLNLDDHSVRLLRPVGPHPWEAASASG